MHPTLYMAKMGTLTHIDNNPTYVILSSEFSRDEQGEIVSATHYIRLESIYAKVGAKVDAVGLSWISKIIEDVDGLALCELSSLLSKTKEAK